MGKRGRPRHPDILTPREREVLALIRDGLSNEDIAGRLGISVDGVKYHVSQILSKLGVSTRQEAADWNEELPPWWQRALAPLAFVSRRVIPITSGFGLLSGILSGALLLAAIAGLSALGFLAWHVRDHSNASQSSAVVAVTTPLLQPTKLIETPVPVASAAPSAFWNAFWQIDAQASWLAGSICQPQSNGTATCGQGIMEKTVDGGSTWQEQYRGDVLVSRFQFIDPLKGWAVGQSVGATCDQDHACPNIVLSTTDGGAHWTPVYTTPPGSVVDIAFIATDGWLLLARVPPCQCAPDLLRTTDAGRTWTDISLPVRGMGLTLSRPTASDAWIASGPAGPGALQIIVTHDDGQTWSSLASPPGASSYEASIFFRSSEQGWLLLGGQPSAGNQAKELFGTSDGGQTWTHLSGSLAHPGATPAPDQGNLGTAGYVGPMFFTSATDGWLSLYRDGLFHSFDGGKTWSVPVAADADSLLDFRFIDDKRGWFLTSPPKLVSITSDGGVTWTRLSLPTVTP